MIQKLLALPFLVISMIGMGSLNTEQSAMNFHSFSVTDIEGDQFDFSKLEGKKVLVINVASECGYTPQYAQLQELYDEFGGDKFEIIGFPANNFGAQEPGSDSEIKSFCQKNYGVTFPMMSKISVKGADTHPVYQWLTKKSENGVDDFEVKWNFHKFLIDEKGNLVGEKSTPTSPTDESIIDWINS